LCTATSVKTIAYDQPVSIKGIGLFGQALLAASEAIVVVLSSKSSLRTMEDDFSGRQAEEELRLKVINKFESMGDLTVASPSKKRPAEGKPEELIKSKRLKEKEKKQRRKELKEVNSPAVGGVKIKTEPTSGTKGGITPPLIKRDGPCMYHLATKLSLKDPSQIPYKCPHGVTECRYRHLALNKTRRDKAETAAKNCVDLTLKALLLTGIASSTDFL
jgi:hypothetical protein